MVVALPELIFYALLFFVLAFAFASKKLTQAIFSPLIAFLRAVPAIGNALAAPFEFIERSITDACGSLEAGCDKLMGAAWHETARLLDSTWKELRTHAAAILNIATPLGLVIAAYHAIRSLVHELTRAAHGVNAIVKTLTREYHGIDQRVRELEREIARGSVTTCGFR